MTAGNYNVVFKHTGKETTAQFDGKWWIVAGHKAKREDRYFKWLYEVKEVV